MRRGQMMFMVTLSSLSSLGVGLLGPIYPIFVLNRFSASIFDVGMLLTIFGLASAIFKAPAGKMVDIYGKERVFLIGVILGAFCSLAYIFAFNIIYLYLIELFFGISNALQDPARLALIMELGDKRKRGWIIGISESAYDVAGSIAAIIAALIASNFGFESVFFTCSGCHVATGLIILRSKRST
ncbi:MAG: MFS transporter [Candidatus Bathyarchaeia archaeon]